MKQLSDRSAQQLPADFWAIVRAGAEGARQLRHEAEQTSNVSDAADLRVRAAGIEDATMFAVQVACGHTAPWAS